MGTVSCKKSPKENHVILKELRNTGLDTNETLCFSVSKTFDEVFGIEEQQA